MALDARVGEGHTLKDAFAALLLDDAGWVALVDADERLLGIATADQLHEIARRLAPRLPGPAIDVRYLAASRQIWTRAVSASADHHWLFYGDLPGTSLGDVLRLHDTPSKSVRPVEPAIPGLLTVYACGPTVYDRAHIGNARPIIVFDVLFRLLRHLYGARHVTYVRNITDVDDKINARAKERGISIRDLTEETAATFHKDVEALGTLRPNVEPRATEHIAEMITGGD